jgi:hypothetical protein
VVVGVAGLPIIQVRRRDPFGVASGVGAGGPAFFDASVVGSAGQGEVVDVGAVGLGPSLDVVYLAVVRGCVAAGLGAPAILGRARSATDRLRRGVASR